MEATNHRKVAPAAPNAMTNPERRLARMSSVLLVLGFVSVLVSLLIRVVDRGPFIPGWDLKAPTQGLMLAAERSPLDAVIEVFRQSREFWLPFPTYSALFTLPSGYLGYWWPWTYWIHVLVLICFVGTLLLLRSAARLAWRDTWVLLLGWGASPMLLSHALAGYPWASGILPHALALCATTSARSRTRWPWTLVLSLLAIESAWHCYDIGHSVGIVFLVAVVVQRWASWSTRAIWALTGVTSVIETLFIHPTTNVRAFGGPRLGAGLGTILTGIGRVAHSFGRLELDLPMLIVLGTVTLFWIRRDRLFVGILFLLQLGAVVFLAIPADGATADALRSRRLILLEGYCLFSLACFVRDARPSARMALAGALLLGNLWQIQVTTAFAREMTSTRAYPMPYMRSAEGVGHVNALVLEHTRRILADVDAGRHVLLVYNLGCYPENVTNPDALIERVFLALGYQRFVESVSVFGSVTGNRASLPIRPIAELKPFLDEAGRGVHAPMSVYKPTSCRPPHPYYVEAKTAAESEAIFATIKRRLTLEPLPDSDRIAEHFAVVPNVPS